MKDTFTILLYIYLFYYFIFIFIVGGFVPFSFASVLKLFESWFCCINKVYYYHY